MKWDKERTEHCLHLFQNGCNDKEVAFTMRRLYSGKCTVHSIRSKRGRMERAGILKRGLAGSSKVKEVSMSKRVKKEYWTQEAATGAVDELRAGKHVRAIAAALKKSGLRKGFNPQAVADLLRKIRVGDIKVKDLPHAEAEQKSKSDEEPWQNPDNKNLIVIDSQLGKERFFIDNLTLATVHDLCIRCKLGLR